MNEQTESRKTKARSPNFPFISLERAIERARQFYDQEKRGAAPFAVAAEHWGFSPSSSGALQTVGALKSYELMIDEGSGSARQVRLTDLGLRILLDSRPDSSEREALKRQAARAPAVASDIYAKWEGKLPSPGTLNHYLLLERKFNEETAKKVADILFVNEGFTRSAKSEMESFFDQIESDDATGPDYAPSGPVGPSSSWPTAGPVGPINQSITPGPGRITVSPPVRQFALPETMRKLGYSVPARSEERIIGPTGDIVLSFFGEPTWDAYEFLRRYIELRQSTLRREAPLDPVGAPQGSGQ